MRAPVSTKVFLQTTANVACFRPNLMPVVSVHSAKKNKEILNAIKMAAHWTKPIWKICRRILILQRKMMWLRRWSAIMAGEITTVWFKIWRPLLWIYWFNIQAVFLCQMPSLMNRVLIVNIKRSWVIRRESWNIVAMLTDPVKFYLLKPRPAKLWVRIHQVSLSQ